MSPVLIISRGWSAVSVSFPLCFTMVSKTLSLLYAEHRAAGLRAPINHHSALPVRMRPCTYFVRTRRSTRFAQTSNRTCRVCVRCLIILLEASSRRPSRVLAATAYTQPVSKQADQRPPMRRQRAAGQHDSIHPGATAYTQLLC